jgi:hypothetical protein
MKNRNNCLQRANDRKRAMQEAGVSAWNKRPVVFKDTHKEKRDRERLKGALEWI